MQAENTETKNRISNSRASVEAIERRSANRTPVHLDIRWRRDAETNEHVGTISDISCAGCFVLAEEAAREGESVILEMPLRDSSFVRLCGKVVYATPQIGFAVEFAFAEDDCETFNALAETYGI